MIRINDVVVAVALEGAVVLCGTPGEARAAAKLRLAPAIDGQQVTLVAPDRKLRIVNMSSGGGVGRFTFGTHELVVASGGPVTLDGEKKSDGPFTAVIVTLGEGDRVHVAVTA